MLDNKDRNEIMKMLMEVKRELRKEFYKGIDNRFEENLNTKQSVADVEDALCELDE